MTTRQNKPRTLAIIPARAGSKGLPEKNWKPLLGRPLFLWSLKAALDSREIDEVVISTDSQEVVRIAEQFGFHVPSLRPSELASDTTSSVDVALFELNRLEATGKYFDVLILIEPTSPLRKSGDLDNGIALLRNNKVQACVSFVIQKQLPQHSFLQNEQGIVRNRENLSAIGRRQDEIAPLYPCGVFYAVKVDALREQLSFYPIHTLGHLVDQTQGFEIDEQIDFDIISKLAEREEFKWLQ